MEEKPPAKKRGRPRKKEKKTERCTVWLAPETKRKLTSEAAHLGIRLSTYAGVRLSREREVYMAEADRGRLEALGFRLHKTNACLERIATALEVLSASGGEAEPPPLEWLREVTELVRRQALALDEGLYSIRPFRPVE
jgi:hypothetical protein